MILAPSTQRPFAARLRLVMALLLGGVITKVAEIEQVDSGQVYLRALGKESSKLLALRYG
jgi:hypothetical protein